MAFARSQSFPKFSRVVFSCSLPPPVCVGGSLLVPEFSPCPSPRKKPFGSVHKPPRSLKTGLHANFFFPRVVERWCEWRVSNLGFWFAPLLTFLGLFPRGMPFPTHERGPPTKKTLRSLQERIVSPTGAVLFFPANLDLPALMEALLFVTPHA